MSQTAAAGGGTNANVMFGEAGEAYSPRGASREAQALATDEEAPEADRRERRERRRDRRDRDRAEPYYDGRSDGPSVR